jgi:hypothetical protein
LADNAPLTFWKYNLNTYLTHFISYYIIISGNFLLAWAGQFAGIENQTMHRFEQYLKILQLYHENSRFPPSFKFWSVSTIIMLCLAEADLRNSRFFCMNPYWISTRKVKKKLVKPSFKLSWEPLIFQQNIYRAPHSIVNVNKQFKKGSTRVFFLFRQNNRRSNYNTIGNNTADI